MKLIHRCNSHNEFLDSFWSQDHCCKSGLKYVNHDDPDFTTAECLGCGELWKYRRNCSAIGFWSPVGTPINWHIPSKFQIVDQKTPTINISEVKERRFEIVDRETPGSILDAPTGESSLVSWKIDSKDIDYITDRRVSAEIMSPFMRPYGYQAIGRKLLMVEELHQGAMDIYK